MTLSNKTVRSALKVAQRVLNNKIIAYDGDNYVGVKNHEGKLIFQAVGDKNKLFLNVMPTEKVFEINIDNKKLGSILSNLDDEIEFNQEEHTLEITDGSAKVRLRGYASDIEEDLSEIMAQKREAHENGRKVNRSELLEVLTYLYTQLSKEDDDEVMGDIYFGSTTSYIFSELYAVQTRYTLPYELILGMESAGVLLELLKASEAEDIIIFKRGESEVDFIVGGSYYQVSGTNTLFANKVNDRFRTFGTEERLKLDVSDFRKFATLAKNFLDDDEQEIVLSVEDGVGKVTSDSADDNSSDGKFDASGVDEIEFSLDVNVILKTISIIADGEIEFQINEDRDTALIEHKKGKILVAISER